MVPPKMAQSASVTQARAAEARDVAEQAHRGEQEEDRGQQQEPRRQAGATATSAADRGGIRRERLLLSQDERDIGSVPCADRSGWPIVRGRTTAAAPDRASQSSRSRAFRRNAGAPATREVSHGHEQATALHGKLHRAHCHGDVVRHPRRHHGRLRDDLSSEQDQRRLDCGRGVLGLRPVDLHRRPAVRPARHGHHHAAGRGRAHRRHAADASSRPTSRCCSSRR